jgi:hypothetical protein
MAIDFTAWQSDVTEGLKQITSAVMQLAIPLAAIGATSMAFIQATKNVTSVWSAFQRVKLRQWLGASLRGDHSYEWIPGWAKTLPSRLRGGDHLRQKNKQRKDELECIRSIEQDLILLATSGDANSFYALAIEDSCDQIRKVLSVVLDYPESHLALLLCLAGREGYPDVDKLVPKHLRTEEGGSHGSESNEDQEVPKAEHVVGRHPARNRKVPAENAALREMTEAKSRLVIKLRCSVDAIQTSIGFRWKFYMQAASMALSAVLGAAAVEIGAIAGHKPAMDKLSFALVAVLTGVLAGFLAPVARDLVAAIEKLRS